MTLHSDNWPRLKVVFADARALPANLRAGYLAVACADDEGLRHEVESLLASDTHAKSFLETPVVLLADTGAQRLEGLRVGPYRITSRIGAGGMGEVYRARDATLGRDVAIKMLPRILASDPDRLARFDREARMLAALNHPHIGAIYGVEQSEGAPALILELVEGPTLADRLAQGPVPLTEALGIARQIADALEAAHARGIVHRDLKPANIKITPKGIVKVLDFGLAKVVTRDEAPRGLIQGPIVTTGDTRVGLIMGTPSYMSPEQARGSPVDKRTDIWAFGCVLYEMLAGRTVFAAATVSDHTTAILERDPDWTMLPEATSPDLRRVLRRCLAKDPARRLQDIGDARVEIEDLLSGAPEGSADAVPSHARPSGRRAVPWAVAGALAALALTAFGAWRWSRAPSDPKLGPLVRSAVVLPDGMERTRLGSPALSPDGTMVVFSAVRDGRAQLFIRRLADAQVTPVDGTERGDTPFFSPDGHWLGFAVGDEIKKVRIEGGQPQVVATLPSIAGASWGDDDTIVLGQRQSSGLWRVPARGGMPERLTTVTAADGDNDHRWPQVLPRGRGVLFSVSTGPEEMARIVVLDSRTGARKDLLTGSASARYVATGHLVYARNAELQAVPFDLERLEITGPAVRVAEGVHEDTDGTPEYAFSDRGDLAYFAGWSGGRRDVLTLVSMDGSAQETAFPRLPINGPRFSPDGRRIAMFVGAAKNNAWVYDIDRASATRVTAGRYHDPMWTKDGRLVVSKGPPAQHDLVLRSADAEGPEKTLLPWHRPQYGGGWMADGRLVIEREGDGTAFDIVALDLATRQVTDVVATPASEERPRVSPDGRWLAYLSNDSGRHEAFVRGLAPGAGRQRVSTNGAVGIGWAPDGRTLYFTGLTDRAMWASRVTTTPALAVGPPARMFGIEPYLGQFDISPDGTRFAMLQRGPSPPRNRLELVQNALSAVRDVR